MMSNSHFRVKLQLKADRANQVALHCEHPTKNGVEPGGWMERESLSLQVCALLKAFAVEKPRKWKSLRFSAIITGASSGGSQKMSHLQYSPRAETGAWVAV